MSMITSKLMTPVLLLVIASCSAQKSQKPADSKPSPQLQKEVRIIPGAERLNVYVPLLKGKRVAVFANQTSMVGDVHLVDTLKKLGVDVKIIFGPEHGFRGT